MKTLAFILFLITTLSYANTEKNVPSSITHVTVYLSDAQVKRTTTITVPVGTTEFVFNRLSPYIQESSIQVAGLKKVSILSVNYGINYITKQNRTTEVESLQKQIADLNDNIESIKHNILGYNEELYLITQNRALGSTTEVVSLEKLQKFASYYRTRTTEIKTLIYQQNKIINELSVEISDLQQQLRELNVDENIQTGEIKIKLNTKTSTSLNLVITYNVTNAGWFPIYDIKSEKINAPIELAYKAHIYQNTGSDWDHVNLTLSTSDPTTNNVKPDINPKYLNFISQYSNYKNNRATKSYNYKYNPLVKTVSGVVTSNSDGLGLPGATIVEKGTSNGTQTDFDGNYSLKTNGGKELVFSYVGFKSEELPIHSSVMNVSMEEDQSMLDEVVVTALGIKRVNESKMLVNNTNAIQNESTIFLRGNNSSSDNTELMYIIDGIPTDADAISLLNENMISSMSVLKGAEAASVYGIRGSNGVVIIETKTGNYTSNGNSIEEGITNTRFDIKKHYSIPSDGDVTVIEIDNFSVPASYSYFAAPLLNENVFLTAKISNWEQYNLLPAEANVYFEGSYSGKTNINPQNTTEQLTISLGVDPNVIVKRTQPTDFKKNTFIGNHKVINKQYDIELKNNKSAAIDLVLFDRIPISQNNDIKIDDIETGTSEYDDKKGILKWKVTIPSNDKQVYTFSYLVKYPKNKRVNL